MTKQRPWLLKHEKPIMVQMLHAFSKKADEVQFDTATEGHTVYCPGF